MKNSAYLFLIVAIFNTYLYAPSFFVKPEKAAERVHRLQTTISFLQDNYEKTEQVCKAGVVQAVIAAVENIGMRERFSRGTVPAVEMQNMLQKWRRNIKLCDEFNVTSQRLVALDVDKRQAQYDLQQAENEELLERKKLKAFEDAKIIEAARKKREADAERKKKNYAAAQAKVSRQFMHGSGIRFLSVGILRNRRIPFGGLAPRGSSVSSAAQASANVDVSAAGRVILSESDEDTFGPHPVVRRQDTSFAHEGYGWQDAYSKEERDARSAQAGGDTTDTDSERGGSDSP